jgi:3-hydroxymyristoyl/3-hydroxydecanoyl-(acyl carrier protein) dehydratase
MCQTAAIVVLVQSPGIILTIPRIEAITFHAPIEIGANVTVTATLERHRRQMWCFQVQTTVGVEKVASSDIRFFEKKHG